MSRSINVVAKYKNNNSVNRGLFNGENLEVSSFLFTPNSVNMMFALLDEDIQNRSIKSVTVSIVVSGGNGTIKDETFIFDTLNDAENKKYTFLDILNFSH